MTVILALSLAMSNTVFFLIKQKEGMVDNAEKDDVKKKKKVDENSKEVDEVQGDGQDEDRTEDQGKEEGEGNEEGEEEGEGDGEDQDPTEKKNKKHESNSPSATKSQTVASSSLPKKEALEGMQANYKELMTIQSKILENMTNLETSLTTADGLLSVMAKKVNVQ
jgi:hypothetical protein